MIFQNRDGTKTLYQYAQPVKYVDETGQVRDKKTSLSTKIGKAEYAADYGPAADNNDVKTYFPKNLSKNKGVVLEYQDIKIQVFPTYKTVRKDLLMQEESAKESGKDSSALSESRQASGASLEMQQSPDVADTDSIAQAENLDNQITLVEAAPAPVEAAQLTADSGRAQDVVEYDGVFGEDTILRYTPTVNGFKEDIILNRNVGVNEFTFRYETNGLSLTREEGSYFFVDPLTGEHIAMLDNQKKSRH